MKYIYVILITILLTSINILISNQQRIESKLNRIIMHFEIPELSKGHINDELRDELIKLVEENKKVKAIKKLRDVTGMELKEAKNYVDSL